MFLLQMATKPAAGKPGLEEELPQVHRIRITLTSKNVKALEKGEPEPHTQQHSNKLPLHCSSDC